MAPSPLQLLEPAEDRGDDLRVAQVFQLGARDRVCAAHRTVRPAAARRDSPSSTHALARAAEGRRARRGRWRPEANADSQAEWSRESQRASQTRRRTERPSPAPHHCVNPKRAADSQAEWSRESQRASQTRRRTERPSPAPHHCVNPKRAAGLYESVEGSRDSLGRQGQAVADPARPNPISRSAKPGGEAMP